MASPRFLWRAFAVLLAGLLVGLTLAVVDPRELLEAFARLGWGTLVAVLAATLLYNVLRGVAWHSLLLACGTPVTLCDSVLIYLAGQAVGMLPGGQLAMSALLKQLKEQEVGESASTIVLMELLYGVIGLVVTIAGAIAYGVDRRVVAVAGGLLVAGFVAFFLPVPPRVLAAGMRRCRALARHAHEVELFHQAFRRLLRRQEVLPCLAFNAAAFAVGTFTLWLPLYALGPQRTSFGMAAFVYGVAHFSVGLPFLPAGLGANEASSVALLSWLGEPLPAAVAATLVSRAVLIAGGTLVGLVTWLLIAPGGKRSEAVTRG